ncbi:hypothetical protein N657DRAFT_245948 [Parathielavia appendiculata]|uniref:UBZ4-type domain-containing protein n=1 Tax=Parathielavia appendiculata TaxID=2587402 RepID=A0AAN6YZF1_9PEZI|nr:hypothetical protein N657DRAFT_245948 [Parathielavia appendiculata]
MPSVPTTKDVVPGALVNIVLKADQPTGRTVQGAVLQLLTRGNHPRGIKVRLTDGRVGRVQSMAGPTEPTPEGSQGQSVSTERTAGVGQGDAATVGERRRHRGGWMQRDAREEQPPSTQAIGLDAYIKPAKKRGKGKNAGNATTGAPSDAADDAGSMLRHSQTSQPNQPPELEASTCPVCGDFRGDAAALTHHVQSHFDD